MHLKVPLWLRLLPWVCHLDAYKLGLTIKCVAEDTAKAIFTKQDTHGSFHTLALVALSLHICFSFFLECSSPRQLADLLTSSGSIDPSQKGFHKPSRQESPAPTLGCTVHSYPPHLLPFNEVNTYAQLRTLLELAT